MNQLDYRKRRSEIQRRYYVKNRSKVLDYHARLRSTPERKKYMSEYAKSNPGKFTGWMRRNPEKYAEVCRRSRIKHRDFRNLKARKKRAKNANEINQRRRIWRKLHPNAQRRDEARRRALLAKAKVNMVGIDAFIDSVRKRKFVRCYYCKTKVRGGDAHIDHIIALSAGGPHFVENLCASCQPCNSRKYNKPLTEWQPEGQRILNL